MRQTTLGILAGFALAIGACPAWGVPVITNVVETGGDNEATDTVAAKWTGVTYVGGIANEPVPGPAGAPYTVVLFGEFSPSFVDRNHRYTQAAPPTTPLPAYLVGGEYIMSGNDNRDNNPNYRLDVTISQPSAVYMLIDNRLGKATAAENNTPPTFNATHMQWILDEGWVPVSTGANRFGDARPDEVGIDENADGTINQWYSVYGLLKPAGTFTLRQADNGGQNMYGVVVVPEVIPEPGTLCLAAVGLPLLLLKRVRRRLVRRAA